MDQKFVHMQLAQKLEAELAKTHNAFMPMVAIRDYLLTAAQTNEVLLAMMLEENRTLAHCAVYVEDKVREALNNTNGYLPDAEVYGMAEDFYYLSNEEIADLINPPQKATTAKKGKPAVANAQVSKPEPAKAAPPVEPQLSLFGADDLQDNTILGDTLADEPQAAPDDIVWE